MASASTRTEVTRRSIRRPAGVRRRGAPGNDSVAEAADLEVLDQGAPPGLAHLERRRQDAVPWLYGMWAAKPMGWIVQWEAIGHVQGHLGEMVSVRGRLGLSPFYEPLAQHPRVSSTPARPCERDRRQRAVRRWRAPARPLRSGEADAELREPDRFVWIGLFEPTDPSSLRSATRSTSPSSRSRTRSRPTSAPSSSTTTTASSSCSRPPATSTRRRTSSSARSRCSWAKGSWSTSATARRPSSCRARAARAPARAAPLRAQCGALRHRRPGRRRLRAGGAWHRERHQRGGAGGLLPIGRTNPVERSTS